MKTLLFSFIYFIAIAKLIWAQDNVNPECKALNILMGKSETFDCCSNNSDEVKCTDNHVTYINLSNHQIMGTLPESIGELVYLEELDLSVNRFTGPIPSSIGNLVKLKKLNLSTNTFEKEIPSTIGNLVELEYLTFDDNYLKEFIPAEIGNLSKLVELNLKKNGLKGHIPSEIGNLINLKKLLLSGNDLKGSIPYSISNLKNLEYLQISNNDLSGELPTEIIEGLPNLKGLTLENNKNLYGRIPKGIYETCKYGVTKLCYSEADKDSNCSYPSTHYDCETCKDATVSTVTNGICKCNDGYKGAGYVECIKCGDTCDIDDSAFTQSAFKLFNIILITATIGFLLL